MDIRPYRVGLLQHLSKRGDVNLTIYAGAASPGLGAPDTPPNVPVPVRPVQNVFWPRNPLKLLWQRKALGMLKDNSDVVIVQEVVTNLSVWAIRLLHRRFRKALVVHGFFYRPEPISRIEWLRTALRRFLWSRADALVTYTDRGRDELLNEGVEPDRIFVSANTLDTTHLVEVAKSVTESESLQVRQELAIPDDAVVVAFLGRLRSVKRINVAVEAVERLSESGTPHVLIVIGGGPDVRLIEDSTVVRWVGQTYDELEIARYLSVASVLAMPGSVGLACVHGFANGLPCITTSDRTIYQTPEFAYVQHERNGIILERGDAEEIASAISDVISNPRRLETLREGAWATARKLDMSVMAGTFAEAIKHAHGTAQTRRPD